MNFNLIEANVIYVSVGYHSMFVRTNSKRIVYPDKLEVDCDIILKNNSKLIIDNNIKNYKLII